MTAVLLIAVAGGAGGGVLWWVRSSLDAIPRVALEQDVLTVVPPRSEPVNVLVAGVDSSAALDPNNPVTVGRDPDSRLTDVLFVARVDPEAGTLTLVSVPRDLWVPIAPSSTPAKVNSALATGGPSAVVATVADALDIPIHHYVQLDMAGFQAVVDAIGGVSVAFPAPVRDAATGLAADTGCVTLDGAGALALVRSRSYEALTPVGWLTDPRGDLGRIERQQYFLQAVLESAARQATNPLALRQLLGSITPYLTLDASLSSDQLVLLATRFLGADLSAVRSVTLPVTPGYVGDASVVFLDPGALAVLADFRAPPVPPATTLGTAAPPVPPATTLGTVAPPLPTDVGPAPVMPSLPAANSEWFVLTPCTTS